MSVAANLLVAQVGAAWTFRIFGLLIWGVCIPAALFIRQPQIAKATIPELQWYAISPARQADGMSPCLMTVC